MKSELRSGEVRLDCGWGNAVVDGSGSPIGGNLWVRSKEVSDSLWTESTLSVAGGLTSFETVTQVPLSLP